MNIDDLPVVLIIEDKPLWQDLFEMTLEGIAVIKKTGWVTGAKMLIDETPHALFVAVDGKLLGGGNGTQVVAYLKKKRFAGLIVAISSDRNNELVAAGATHSVPKGEAAEFLKNLVIETKASA